MESKQAVLILDKKRGETPLECLNRFKKDNLNYGNKKMTYAGRLDPLASGLLLALVGEECKNKDKYLSLDKEYEVDILFGFSTDSYDVLGLVVDSLSEFPNNIEKILKTFIGKFSQKYPPFSSKTVDGKQLFLHTREKTILSEDIPSKDVQIKKIDLVSKKIISKLELHKFIKDSICLVSGDFRQKEIENVWNNVIEKNTKDKFEIISIKVSCTSGTYMRSLANEIGLRLGIPALALNIRRTKVGDYILTNPPKYWTRLIVSFICAILGKQ